MSATLDREARHRQTPVPVAGTRSGQQRRPRYHRQEGAAHVFMTPWLLGFVFVTSVPLFASLYLAFTDYNILTFPEFTGLENFQRMADDRRFWAAVGVTLR